MALSIVLFPNLSFVTACTKSRNIPMMTTEREKNRQHRADSIVAFKQPQIIWRCQCLDLIGAGLFQFSQVISERRNSEAIYMGWSTLGERGEFCGGERLNEG
jgi:hypothetical protein